ncbi:MAG: helix-turn-helix domain-containing protein [Actinomycetota bacterium]|nr:helix-turn-helix domain-containing protein [Actinomycetota bacterium]
MYEPTTSWYCWMMQRAPQDTPAPVAQLELAVSAPAAPDDADGPLLLTVKEAAALMRVGRDTTYSLVAQRRIPCIKLGKQIRIPRKALIAHLEKEALQQTLDLDQDPRA